MAAVRKIAILIALGLAVAVAVVATSTLGNPLGRAIGREDFPHRVEHGQAAVGSAVAGDFAATAAYADAWLGTLSGWLGVPARPVEIRLFRDRATFDRRGAESLPRFAKGMDWCYDPGSAAIYGWVMEPAEMRSRLRHELFHHAARGLDLPPWLEEGTAELLERSEHDAAAIAIAGIQRDRLVQAARIIAAQGADAVGALIGLDRQDYRGRDRDRWYHLGYAAAAWLVSDGRLGAALRAGAEARRALDPSAPFIAFASEPNRWRDLIGRSLDVPAPSPAP